MKEEVIGAFIPIIMFLVIGLIWVTALYLRSKERQMLIEKGLSTEEIKAFFENKRVSNSNPYVLAKIGVIIIFFGLGLGIGLYLQDIWERDYWVPFLMFVFTGVGFVLANHYGSKFGKIHQTNP